MIPLGGCGEVGMNMTVYRHREEMVLVDVGLMFPDEEMLGVDVVLADISFLREQGRELQAIFLTHGHEDHIGALVYLLRDLPKVPIYGTAMTLGLVKAKLRELGLLQAAELRQVEPRDRVVAGRFEVEYLQVTHSILGGCSLAITCPAGTVIHTGDFKIDPHPVDGRLFDTERFRAYGDQGVLALCSDSTNAENPGRTLSEREVGKALDEAFGEAGGLIVVATFASHIQRVQQIVEVADAHHRKVVVMGRSMERNVEIALELGLLHIPQGMRVMPARMGEYHRERLVVITTGSQGEPLSALSRLAVGDHRYLSIEPGDTVILSSKAIPGNERSVSRVINHLLRRGARVVHGKVSEIHVSGHAAQEELAEMYRLVRPRYFIPVHGELRHLVAHRDLILSLGHPAKDIAVVEDGAVVELSPRGLRLGDEVAHGRTFVDGKGVGEVGDVVLRDRRLLAEDGTLVIVVGIDHATGEVVQGPDIISRGFVYEDESQELLEEIKQVVVDLLPTLDKEILAERALVAVRIRNKVRRYLDRKMGRRPMVLPMVLE
ncbi:MAG: ribonuclease J [Nitrospirae bacterium]|nr:MAG: ribonuclease J [Nitrospirota bacterium]